jgi:LmbE family N-acetylglucosaminyl deacetylase
MKFQLPESDVYVPRADVAAEQALARTTHLCIAAHQDDVEIMAYHGIAECFGRDDAWFSAVIVTNGGGSPRSGSYRLMSDEAMQHVRRDEQKKAAALGDYSTCLQLAYPSAVVKDARDTRVVADLTAILRGCRPQVLYVHNPADKHDTHIAVLLRTLAALRTLPAGARPRRVIGCEVWRNLDWLVDPDKVELDDSARPNLAAALLGVFDSQISGGKRYDLAATGRRLANATFHTSHATDKGTAFTWGIDLTPAIEDLSVSIESLTLAAIDRFRDDVRRRLERFR